MATTIDTYLPFDAGAGAGVTESGWRDMAKHFVNSASGVIRGFDSDFSTIGDSSGMQIKVASGQCFMRGHYGRNASTRTLAIATAHATLARKDAAIIRCDFVNNRIEVDVLTGTASGSPVLPTLTQNTSVWETLLAEVNVAAAVVTITAGNVVDRRVYTTVIAKYSRSSAFAITASSAFTEFQCNTTEIASGDVVPNSTLSQFTLNRAGLWTMTWYCGFAVSSVGGRSIQIRDSGSTVYVESSQVTSSGSINTYIAGSTTERFSVGQIVRPIVWQSSGGSLNTIAGATFTINWIGP